MFLYQQADYQLNTFEQEAVIKAATTRMIAAKTIKVALKRKVGYMDEAVSITRSKLSQLRIAESEELGAENGVEGATS